MSWDDLKLPLFAQWKPWWLSRHPKEIGEYSWIYLFERGKQIRPRLFCELWRYLCPEQTPMAELGFMVECVHVASLILDDLPWMDNAKERRGWETLHQKFTARKAILLAHDVLELAWEVGQTTPFATKSKEWEQWIRLKADSLWRGQWLDLSQSGTLEELAELKTGILFECVAELVAIAIGLNPYFWRGWGRTLGILFQWVDDWDDREEDRIIQQRNAFNECYEETMTRYHVLWIQVVQGIGPGWWERPFGIFLWNYFTRIGRNEPILSLTSVRDLDTLFHSVPKERTIIDSMEATTLALRFMKKIYSYIDYPVPEKQQKPDISYLWKVKEVKWIEEVQKIEETKPFLSLLEFYEDFLITDTTGALRVDEDEDEDEAARLSATRG